ncbi:MAG: acyl-CoA desaturase [Planctomycetota bacterium]
MSQAPSIERSARAARPSATVSSPRIQAVKRRFVLGLNGVSGAGFAVAVILLVSGSSGWGEVLLFAAMYALTGIGISVGYHRFFTHRAFDAPLAVRAALGVAGSMAGHGPLVSWVATHRAHHQKSDREGDPHSPHLAGETGRQRALGLWHAHMGWLLNSELPNSAVFARDLLGDPLARRLNRGYPLLVLAGLLAPAVLWGLVHGGWGAALQGLIWGGLARQFAGFHATCSINSLGHALGRRAFDTRDRSRNNYPLALATFGEGWHNNHHAYPSSARFGLRWWQLDVGYLVVATLALLGLAVGVKGVGAGKTPPG